MALGWPGWNKGCIGLDAVMMPRRFVAAHALHFFLAISVFTASLERRMCETLLLVSALGCCSAATARASAKRFASSAKSRHVHVW